MVDDPIAPTDGVLTPYAPGGTTKWRPEFVDQARQLCRLGATDGEVSEFFGVTTMTLWLWRGNVPELAEAMKVGKDQADERVARAMYQRAVGYTFDSEKVHVARDGEVTRIPMKEHMPPDVAAASFWLKNRRPDAWQDKSYQNVTGDVTVIITDEEAKY